MTGREGLSEDWNRTGRQGNGEPAVFVNGGQRSDAAGAICQALLVGVVVVRVVETRSDDGDDNRTPVQVRWGSCGSQKFLVCLLPIGPCALFVQRMRGAVI